MRRPSTEPSGLLRLRNGDDALEALLRWSLAFEKTMMDWAHKDREPSCSDRSYSNVLQKLLMQRLSLLDRAAGSDGAPLPRIAKFDDALASKEHILPKAVEILRNDVRKIMKESEELVPFEMCMRV